MIRKTVAITIFATSMLAAGCSSSDDDSAPPSNDEIAGLETSDTGDVDATGGTGTEADTETDAVALDDTPVEPTPPADASDGTVGTTPDTTSELDDTGAGPAVPPEPPATDAPGEDASEVPTSGPGVDDTTTVDGAPVMPSDEETTGAETTGTETTDAETTGTETTDAEGTDTEITDTETTETTEGGDQPLSAALRELDGNPEGSRALITRQLLDRTDFGAMLDDSNEPFTMFVPTDAAFISLGMSLEQLLDDPELGNTIEFHIAQGEALDRAMLDARSGQELTMSNGQSNPLSQNGESLQIGSAAITEAPGGGRVNNGVFYLIDQILIPATGE